MRPTSATPGPTCQAIAHLVPLLADAPTSPEIGAARDHARDCAYCQRALADYQRLDNATRRHYAARVPQTLRTEDIMDEIDISATRIATKPRLTFRQWTPLVSAALIVTLLVVSFGVFAQLAQRAKNSAGTTKSASDGAMTAISMIAPTDGWAVSNPWLHGWDLNIPSTLLSSTLYHYQQGVWRPVELVAPAYRAVRIEHLKMFADSDGWALADAIIAPGKTREVILHYDGQQWTTPPAPNQILPDHDPAFVRFTDFQALSDTSIWLAMFALSDADGVSQLPAVAHLIAGHSWTIERLPLPTNARGQGVNFAALSIAMVNDDEGWLSARISSGTGNDQGEGVLYHRLRGAWTIAAVSREVMYTKLTMFSATDGWASGEYLAANQAATDPPIIARYANGAWTPQTIGITEPGANDLLAMQTPGAGWLFTTWNHAQAYHFDGAVWRFSHDLTALVHVANLEGVNLLAANFTSATDGWVAGYVVQRTSDKLTFYLPVMFHEDQGAWNVTQF